MSIRARERHPAPTRSAGGFLPDQPLRLLHIYAPAAAGGLESVVQMLALGQRERGAAVAVVAVLDEGAPEPPSVEALRSAGVPVFVQRSPRRGYRTEWSSHRHRVAVWRPDVVHTHGYRADVLAGHAVGRRARRIATVHGFTGGDWKNQVYEWLQIQAYRRFDAVIAVSRSVRDRLLARGVGPRTIELIPNAWAAPAPPLSRAEARARLGLAADAIVIGWVGRLSREKGADVLLAAAARLPGTQARISIIGDGQERATLEAAAGSLGITERIAWHGLVPGAGRLMPAFDLFVLSSRTEGTPIAVFEAMAARVPIVATAVGGVPDMLDPDSAWLVSPVHPVQLAGAIEEALSDRSAAGARAARAAIRLERDFAAGPWIDRYLEVAHRLVRGRPALTS